MMAQSIWTVTLGAGPLWPSAGVSMQDSWVPTSIQQQASRTPDLPQYHFPWCSDSLWV